MDAEYEGAYRAGICRVYVVLRYLQPSDQPDSGLEVDAAYVTNARISTTSCQFLFPIRACFTDRITVSLFYVSHSLVLETLELRAS